MNSRLEFYLYGFLSIFITGHFVSKSLFSSGAPHASVDDRPLAATLLVATVFSNRASELYHRAILYGTIDRLFPMAIALYFRFKKVLVGAFAHRLLALCFFDFYFCPLLVACRPSSHSVSMALVSSNASWR